MPQISIIVPVYNSERYLKDCLDSLRGQSFSDLEVILVDDGSSDTSVEICKDYAREDGRFQVVCMEHKGVSAARNTGLSHASGRYLAFVDSDDFIAPDWCEVLWTLLQEQRLPIAISKEVDDYGNAVGEYRREKDWRYDRETVLERMFLAENLRAHVASALFDRALFEGIFFPEVGVCEDAWVLLELLLRAPGILRTDRTAYFYRRREGSLMTAPYSEKDLDCVRVWKRNWDVLTQHFPHLYDQGKTRCVWACYFVLDKACLTEGALQTEAVRQITAHLRKETGYVLTNRYFTVKRKASAILLFISPVLYRWVRCWLGA